MKARVLIVDDEEILRYTFKCILSRQGYDVETAKDYDEGVDKLETHTFDIMFVDILLGEKTGIDFLEKVSASKIVCPVIMITGAPDIKTATSAVRFGAFDYISKPVLKETLFHAAERALQHKLLVDDRNKYRLNLEAIFRSVEEGILSVDEEGRVVEVNNAMAEICGYSTEETVGKLLPSLKLDCNHQCHDLLMETIKTGLPVKKARAECLSNDHHEQVVALATTPLIDDMGNSSGAVLIVRDESRLAQLEQDLEEYRHFHRLIGRSEKMQQLYALLENLSKVKTTVLVTGESGTGKELVAHALHAQGSRKDKPLIKVNCSALSENLLESELFGYVKGAYTGATADKMGRIEKANGGTLFLDEIGDISHKIQLQLLRFLQEKVIERVGDSTPIEVDVRIVTATNRDMQAMIDEGKLRKDLFYRLKVVEVTLPPLRERREDIALLVQNFVGKFNKEFDKKIDGISDIVLQSFMSYDWPGNVRELEHSLEHAFIMCNKELINMEHLPIEMINAYKNHKPSPSLPENECRQIVEALEKCGWNRVKAASILRMSRMTLYRKMVKYKLGQNK